VAIRFFLVELAESAENQGWDGLYRRLRHRPPAPVQSPRIPIWIGSGFDEEHEHRREVAGAGADWWVEWIAPDERETMRAAVARGPLRVD
jgi:hypothetical protein